MSDETVDGRVALIRTRLQTALNPNILDIQDNSKAHANHPGAKQGGGHFNVKIVSKAFAEKSLVERHKMVYQALDNLIGGDVIHAIQITALSPEEA